MRALLGVADQPGAVERGGGGDAVGIAGRGGQRIGAAHAVAMAPTGPGFTASCRSTNASMAATSSITGGIVILVRPRACVVARGCPPRDVRPEDRVPPGAVIQVGQQHVVADGREPARHVPQLLADAVRIHQEQHGGIRPAPLGMADEGLHRAVFGGDIQVCSIILLSRPAFGRSCAIKAATAARFK